MEEIAEVVEPRGDKALVRIIQHSACSKCSKECALAESSEAKELLVEVDSLIDVRKGQQVKLELKEKSLVSAAIFIYLFPLLAVICGYFLGDWISFHFNFGSGEGMGIMGTLIFLGLSFLSIKLYSPRLESKVDFDLAITQFAD